VAFFMPYGIHTEIRPSATPVRSSPGPEFRAWLVTCPGALRRLTARRWRVWRRWPRPSLLPNITRAQGVLPCHAAARRARRSLTGLRAADRGRCLPSCRPWWLSWWIAASIPRAVGASIWVFLPRRVAPSIDSQQTAKPHAFGWIGNRFRSGPPFFRSGGRVIYLVNPPIFFAKFLGANYAK